MGHLKIVELDESNILECERLRRHPGNLVRGELGQARAGGFFRYFDFISDEHHHWGVSDGSALLGMVSLAIARTPSQTIVLLTDFFSHPESRQRLSSRKIIERVHEFIQTLSGPVVLLAIENRYRHLDSLVSIAKRFGFDFKTDQILQSVAVRCVLADDRPGSENLTCRKLADSSESVRRSLASAIKADLSWPPVPELLGRIIKIDPDARLISTDDEHSSSWALLYSEQKYRSYEMYTHVNIIASDERLISEAAVWAGKRGCDWLLMREPFPRVSRESWPAHVSFNNRVMIGFRTSERSQLEPLTAAHLFQGLTL